MLSVLKGPKGLRGKNRLDTLENYSIAGIISGAVLLAGGIGLTAISAKGFPALLAMFGAVVSFCASVALVFVWLAKEIFEKASD